MNGEKDSMQAIIDLYKGDIDMTLLEANLRLSTGPSVRVGYGNDPGRPECTPHDHAGQSRFARRNCGRGHV